MTERASPRSSLLARTTRAVRRIAEGRIAVGRTVQRIRRVAVRLAQLGAVGGIALVIAALSLYAATDVERARFARPEDSVTVSDRHGTPLRHHRPDGHDRRWVTLDRVSPHLIDAVLAVEDARFYEHHGVDARSTVRAVFSFVLPGRRVSGASTITQQVVKLVYGRPSGLWDKPLEIARAIHLERRFDKDWILEQYLNRLPYGDQVVGVARASELYFGVPPSQLSLAQASLLAGVPQAPSALDPRRHLARATRRRRVVLARMRQVGRIDAATEARVAEEPVSIVSAPVRPWRAARFVDASIDRWRAGELLQRAGEVETSLDLPIQEDATRILRGAVAQLAPRGVTNGAAIVVSNATGEVLAYVGAANEGSDAAGGWLDLAAARRQPGSTLKPFVYELFFERGGTAATLLDDIERPMLGHDGALFMARDYDGHARGPTRARAALASSLNLAALDAARRVGPERIVRRLRGLGMSELDGAERYGAAIVLGGADVSVRELAEAYVTLARGGTHVPLRFGRAEGPLEGEPEMTPAAAAVTQDILRDARARREAFGDDLSAELPGTRFGLKTGTSSGWHDAWTAAFTEELTVVVWLGDPAGQPLGTVSGFEGAARPAVRILAVAQDRAASVGLPVFEAAPAPLVEMRICAVTGLLAGPRCTHTLDERFEPGAHLPSRCEAHLPDGRVELDGRYARWLTAERPAGFALSQDDVIGTPTIVHPSDGARLLVDHDETGIPLRALVGERASAVRWEVDGAPIDGERWQPTEGEHVLIARLGDEASSPVRVSVRRVD
ncbi:MAG: transglycosylase domain-containing protein [Sandaracinaceae bacterium]